MHACMHARIYIIIPCVKGIVYTNLKRTPKGVKRGLYLGGQRLYEINIVILLFILFILGKVELHGKVLEVEHSVPKRQR